MANAGQAVLTVVGTVVGAYFGQPQLGYAIGSLAGQALFPTQLPDAVGPRLDDVAQPPSTVGTTLSLSYGTGELRGLPVWLSPYTEHENENQAGGKGGPEQTQRTYTYTRSYAVLFGCREKAACLAIRRNGQWVYDVRPQRDDEADNDFQVRLAASSGYLERIEIYLGDSLQLPSPTIEAVEGVGNVPAYRGRPYIVFIDDDVTAMRTLPADVIAIWADDATSTNLGEVEYANDVLYPWSSSGIDPRACLNDHLCAYSSPLGGGSITGVSFEDARDFAIADYSNAFGGALDPAVIGYDMGVFAIHPMVMSPIDAVELGEYNAPNLHLSYPEYVATELRLGTIEFDNAFPGGGMAPALSAAGVQAGQIFYWTGNYTNGGSYSGLYVVLPFGISPSTAYDWSHFGFILDAPFEDHICWNARDARIVVSRVPRGPDNPCQPHCSDPYPLLPENPAYCLIGDVLESNSGYSQLAGTYKALQAFVQLGNTVTKYPLNPVRPSTDPDYNSSTAWTADYNQAVADGLMAPGLVYGVDYPVEQAHAWLRGLTMATKSGNPVSLASIVVDLALRSGLSDSDIDVPSAETVEFFLIGRQMIARGAIEQLQAAYLFDVIDDAILRCVQRGGPVGKSYVSGELGAHYLGEAPPACIVLPEITQPSELPSSVTIRYLDSLTYATAEQHYGAQSPEQQNAVTYDLALALTPDQAKRLAQILYTQAHVGAERYSFALGPRSLDRLPGDVVEVPLGGEATRCRLVQLRGGLPGVIQADAVRDDAPGWSSYALGVATPGQPDTIRAAGPTQLTLLNLPVISEADNSAAYKAVVRGYLAGWLGSRIQRSYDAGGSWETAGDALSEAAQGIVGAPPVAAQQWTWDRASSLTVTLTEGAFESRPESVVINGANLFAYQVRDAVGETIGWELCQFVTAAEIGGGVWMLSQLLWGRSGTEWAIGQHQAGDRLVLLSTGVARLPLETGRVSTEISHRAVSIGTSPDATAVQQFTPQGIALRPFAPAYIRGERTLYGDVTISWLRRTRLPIRWRDGLAFPLAEDSEAYDVEFLLADTVTATYRATQPSLTLRAGGFGRAESLESALYFALHDDAYFYGLEYSGAVAPSLRLVTSTLGFEEVDTDFILLGPPVGIAQDANYIYVAANYDPDQADLGFLARFVKPGVAGTDSSLTGSFAVGDPRAIVCCGGSLWACCNYGPPPVGVMPAGVNRINPDTWALEATVSMGGSNLGGFGLATEGAFVWVDAGTSIKRINPATDTVDLTYALPAGDGSGGAVAWNRRLIYHDGALIIWHAGLLTRLNAATGAVEASVDAKTGELNVVNPTGTEPLTAFGPYLAVSSINLVTGARALLLLDIETLDLLSSISLEGDFELGENPAVIAFVDGTLVAVDYKPGGNVTSLDGVPRSDLYRAAGGLQDVRIYQISAAVGRGYPGVATI